MKYVFSFLMIFVLCDFAAQPIIGGQPADEGEYPWMASIVMYDSLTGLTDQGCGASLIDPYWVLTAAHCVEYFSSNDPDLRIIVNSLTTDVETLPSDAEQIKVVDIIVHEEFDDVNFSFGYDIALIRLKEPANTQPIELATYSDSLLYQDHMPAKVLGWGIVDSVNFKMPDSLLIAEPVFIDIDTCAQLYTNSQYGQTVSDNLDRLICSGYYEGMAPVGAASGDSGGPLFYEDGGNYKQVGIVSGGDRLITTQQFPGVFVFIPHFLDWIYETMANYEEPSSVSHNYEERLQYYITQDNNVNISALDPSDNYSFRIYDLAGRTCIDNEESIGIYERSIELNNLNSGMHILLVQNHSEGTYFNYKLTIH